MFQFFENQFSENELNSVVEILPKDLRKIRWDIPIDQKFEPVIEKIRERIIQKFPDLKINTAILKRYKIGENSGAYILHTDPEEFSKGALIMITLSGEATFGVEIENKIHSVECKRGTVVILRDALLPHVVTPPKNENGVRDFLFFGYSSPH